MADEPRSYKIYYSATVVTPDGSDTSPDGDGTEEGHGATAETGWISPDRSYTRVYEDRDQVEPDVFEPDPDFDDPASLYPLFWLVSTLSHYDRLYSVETDSVNLQDLSSVTLYSTYDREERDDGNGFGDSHVSMAAHVEGFTLEEITQALVALTPPLDARYRLSIEFVGDYHQRVGLLPGQMWVARYDGEMIGTAPTMIDALQLNVNHRRAVVESIKSIG